MDKKTTRNPVSYLYTKLVWGFIKHMAMIAVHAEAKYTKAEQYTHDRLIGQAGPLNHICEHLRQYLENETDDKTNSVEDHLASIAYNAMMEWYYYKKWGPPPESGLFIIPESKTTQPEPKPTHICECGHRKEQHGCLGCAVCSSCKQTNKEFKNAQY